MMFSFLSILEPYAEAHEAPKTYSGARRIPSDEDVDRALALLIQAKKAENIDAIETRRAIFYRILEANESRTAIPVEDIEA